MDLFRYEYEESDGWQFREGSALTTAGVGPVVRGPLQLQALPDEVPIVAHVRRGAEWYVLYRPAGQRIVRGMALSGAEYEAMRFDPFTAIERWLGRRLPAAT